MGLCVWYHVSVLHNIDVTPWISSFSMRKLWSTVAPPLLQCYIILVYIYIYSIYNIHSSCHLSICFFSVPRINLHINYAINDIIIFIHIAHFHEHLVDLPISFTVTASLNFSELRWPSAGHSTLVDSPLMVVLLSSFNERFNSTEPYP